MKVAVGHSEDIDAADAIAEVLESCGEQLGEATPQAGLLFSAIDYDHQALLDGVMDRYPDLQLIGATTDGEVSSIMGFLENSVTLMLFQSDRVSFATGVGHTVKERPIQAGREAARMAMEKLDGIARLCIATPEGLIDDMETVLDGIAAALGGDVPICGGLAGDQIRLTGTYQFYGREVLSASVPVLLFSDPVVFSTAVGCGWQPIGGKHVVTAAEGVMVKQIDGKPATELYEEYMGGFSIDHPMMVFTDEMDRSYLSSGMSTQDGEIVFRQAIPVGSHIQLSTASRDDAVAGAATAAASVVESYPGSSPAAGLIFSCAGRRQVLGTRVTQEYEVLKANLGSDVPVCGFYTYGEICPLPGNTTPQAHDSTFVTVLIGED